MPRFDSYCKSQPASCMKMLSVYFPTATRGLYKHIHKQFYVPAWKHACTCTHTRTHTHSPVRSFSKATLCTPDLGLIWIGPPLLVSPRRPGTLVWTLEQSTHTQRWLCLTLELSFVVQTFDFAWLLVYPANWNAWLSEFRKLSLETFYIFDGVV